MAFLLQWLLFLHPFYVSVTELNHNARTGALEISIRTFTNDLEATLRKTNPAAKIDLLNTATAQQQADDLLIDRYIRDRLMVFVNGKNQPLHFVGRENQEENTWSYYEITGVKSMQQLRITNKLLYDWQPQQSNMHVVKYGGREQTKKLNNPDATAEFHF